MTGSSKRLSTITPAWNYFDSSQNPIWTGLIFGLAGSWAILAIFSNRRLLKRFPSLIEWNMTIGPKNGGATVPLHNPPGTCQRTRANQRCWASRAEAEDPVARRHHAPGDVATRVHAAPGSVGATPATALDPLPWCAGTQRQAARDGGIDSKTQCMEASFFLVPASGRRRFNHSQPRRCLKTFGSTLAAAKIPPQSAP